MSAYSLIFMGETPKAIKVINEETSEDFWLPKSQIEYDPSAFEGEVIDVEIPDWLAKNAGLKTR